MYLNLWNWYWYRAWYRLPRWNKKRKKSMSDVSLFSIMTKITYGTGIHSRTGTGTGTGHGWGCGTGTSTGHGWGCGTGTGTGTGQGTC